MKQSTDRSVYLKLLVKNCRLRLKTRVPKRPWTIRAHQELQGSCWRSCVAGVFIKANFLKSRQINRIRGRRAGKHGVHVGKDFIRIQMSLSCRAAILHVILSSQLAGCALASVLCHLSRLAYQPHTHQPPHLLMMRPTQLGFQGCERNSVCVISNDCHINMLCGQITTQHV